MLLPKQSPPVERKTNIATKSACQGRQAADDVRL